MKNKIVSLVGARPQFVKEAVIASEVHKTNAWNHILVHSGQHYDANMSDLFFEELHIPTPQYFLEVGSSRHVVERLMNLLNEQAKPLKKSSILLCGVAYKGDIDDLRESPALKIWKLLEQKGAIVTYFDPCCPSVAWKGKKILSTPLTKDVVQKADAVIITTAHKENVDYRLIAENAQLIFDTKNILSQILNIKPETLNTLHIL